jgi:hypothetical protein
MTIATRRLLAASVLAGCSVLGAPSGPLSTSRARADHDTTPHVPLTLDALAYSLPLVPNAQRAVHSALLPLAVYRGVVSPDLADLRVFDAGGQELPHALRLPGNARDVGPDATPLPMFPIYPDPSRPGDAIETLALRVERDADGTVIAIQPSSGGAAARDAEQADLAGAGAVPAQPLPVAYVLDASRLSQPIVALQLQLTQGKDYMLPLSIEASDDLGSFRTVASGQPLVLLRYDGWLLVQHRIELPSVTARYLRVRWPGHALPAPLATAVAEHGLRREPIEQPLTRVRGTRSPGDAASFDFDLGGPLPVDAFRVVLPEDNTVVDLELASYAKRGDEPEFLHRGIAWRVLHGGTRIETPLLDVHRRQHRYFRLRVAQKGGGLGRGTPELELRYRPHQLLFVARGQPPYQLGYGHHAATPSRFEASELLAMLPEADRASLPASDCTLGEPRTRAGRAALTAPPPPPPYRRYALWGVLIAGAAALGIAALRIGRGLR